MNKNKLRVAVTHDVDRIFKSYHYFSKSYNAIKKGNFNALGWQIKSLLSRKNTYWNFDDILKIENELGIKATYFFLNESIPFKVFSSKNWVLSIGRYNIEDHRIVNIMKALLSQGHEVGLHGSFNSYKDKVLLFKEKKILENILGNEIIGIRQHHLNLNENTWQIQYDCGFKYDTSFGYNRDFGFKDNKIRPFYPLGNEFVEFPMTIMDFCFSNHPHKWKKLNELIIKTKENNGILVLNWHTDTFHPKEFPKHRKDFIEILNILNHEGACFRTLKEYYIEMKI